MRKDMSNYPVLKYGPYYLHLCEIRTKKMIKNIVFLALTVLVMSGCCERSSEKTLSNLVDAIDIEIASGGSYAAFAVHAVNNGQPEIAAMFKAASDVESIHVYNFFNVMDQYGAEYDPDIMDVGYEDSIAVNLQSAINSEIYAVDMYEEMLKQIPRKDSTSVLEIFTWALDNSKHQLDMFKKALADYNAQAKFPSEYFICTSCGKLFIGELPSDCPVCGERSSEFLNERAEDNMSMSPEVEFIELE